MSKLNKDVAEETSSKQYKPKKPSQNSDPAVSVCEQNPCLCRHVEHYRKLCDERKQKQS